MIERHRIVRTTSRENCGEIYGKAPSSKGERQDFNGISDRQRREGNVIESEEDEEEGDCGTSSSLDGMLREGCA